jgi:N-acetylneuraminate synthase
MTVGQYSELAKAVVRAGCIPMATPFDEKSVDVCVDLDFPIIKIASSDINDWSLLEKIATTKRHVIASTGGASEKSIDEIAEYFLKRDIPLALNHCVSLYPSEDDQLELNQITYLKNRYPDITIGFSSHEYHDWASSMPLSYALGARTWERHVDIDFQDVPVSPYCSKPEQIDAWFKAFNKSIEMCGNSAGTRRIVSSEEVRYLDALVRGVYVKEDLEEGYVFDSNNFSRDFKLAIPLRKGQLSTREILNGQKLRRSLKANEPLTIEDIDGPYSTIPELKLQILNRGL